jgi:uncharacterized protein
MEFAKGIDAILEGSKRLGYLRHEPSGVCLSQSLGPSSGPNNRDCGGSDVALELRPNCEYCDKDLPPNSTDARICSYECTFCAGCADGALQNVCPNCGGGFVPRPIRPAKERRPGLSLAKRPASTTRVRLSYAPDDIASFVREVAAIAPEKR